MSYSLPELLELAVTAKLTAMQSGDIVRRIWEKDASVWTNSEESKWLGWLTIADEELGNLEHYKAFKGYLDTAGFENVFREFSERAGVYGYGDSQVRRLVESL